MPVEALSLFWFTESPLHAGAGATLSAIDLPIQRETHTHHPIIFASGVKGALRELATDAKGALTGPYEAVFGPPSNQASDHGGLGIFSEARVALFPVASFQGIFLWVTCPRELYRMKRALLAIEDALDGNAKEAARAFQALKIPGPGVSGAAAASGCSGIVKGTSKIFLDEAEPLEVEQGSAVGMIDMNTWFIRHAFPVGSEYEYWREKAKTDIVVVHDDEFGHLTKYATHIEIHIKIGPEGTVEEGPWSEESLPPDTLLYSTVVLPEALHPKVKGKLNGKTPRQAMVDLLSASGNKRFQLCGGQSTGQGWVCPRMLD